MDTAKGCNFLMTQGGRMQDYWGVGRATKPMLPLIAISPRRREREVNEVVVLIADDENASKDGMRRFESRRASGDP